MDREERCCVICVGWRNGIDAINTTQPHKNTTSPPPPPRSWWALCVSPCCQGYFLASLFLWRKMSARWFSFRFVCWACLKRAFPAPHGPQYLKGHAQCQEEELIGMPAVSQQPRAAWYCRKTFIVFDAGRELWWVDEPAWESSRHWQGGDFGFSGWMVSGF